MSPENESNTQPVAEPQPTAGPEQTTAQTPPPKTNKQFALCDCNGKLHGYITEFPAIIVSVRVGEDILKDMLNAGEVTAEEKELIVAQMKAAGLPDERAGDFEVGVKSAIASLDPIEFAVLELFLSLDEY